MNETKYKKQITEAMIEANANKKQLTEAIIRNSNHQIEFKKVVEAYKLKLARETAELKKTYEDGMISGPN